MISESREESITKLFDIFHAKIQEMIDRNNSSSVLDHSVSSDDRWSSSLRRSDFLVNLDGVIWNISLCVYNGSYSSFTISPKKQPSIPRFTFSFIRQLPRRILKKKSGMRYACPFMHSMIEEGFREAYARNDKLRMCEVMDS